MQVHDVVINVEIIYSIITCYNNMQVHDEVILEGPDETAEEALAETVRCMEQPWDDIGLKGLRVSLPFC